MYYLAKNYFYERLTAFDAHCSETRGGRQKTAEISFDRRSKDTRFSPPRRSVLR
jgi:hypothetical protein